MATTGYVVWEGLSPATLTPIVAILVLKSINEKTGNIPQLVILDAAEEPHVLVKQGNDRSICGDCPLRAGNGCYVVVGNMPLAVYRKWRRGGYPPLPAKLPERVTRKQLRLGSYGDPMMLPYDVIDSLASQFAGSIGYGHQWAAPWADVRFARYLMASTEDVEQTREAQRLGYRTFRITTPGEPVQSVGKTVVCPNERTGITCNACKHCNGTRTHRTGSVTITAHGSKKGKIQTAAAQLIDSKAEIPNRGHQPQTAGKPRCHKQRIGG